MTDFIRKALMAGVGLTASTFRAVEGELKKLVELGKLNASEADKVLDKLARAGEKQFQESRKALEGMVQAVVKKSGLARQGEVRALEKRVATLEVKLGARGKQRGARK